jgi:hypothetical protein
VKDPRAVPAAPPFNLEAHRRQHFWDWSETFTIEGGLSVKSYPARLPLPFRSVLVLVFAFVDTAPTGAAIILDLNHNGTTIFTDQAKRPHIAVSAFNTGNVLNIDGTIFDPGDHCKLDVDQVGSTIAGSDLTCATYWRFAN